MGANVTIQDLLEKKSRGKKITMLTAYDYPFARLVDQTDIDVILVGDSLANVVLGLSSTREVTLEEMLHHTKAVARAVSRAMIVGDMPYVAYQENPSQAAANARQFIGAGCAAVKVEWFDRCLEVVEQLTCAGIPVMGHIGLTPQTAEKLGGFKVQGKDAESAQKLILQAKALQDKGCFSIVLECIPSQVADIITRELKIPTIGIGAGVDCDGQVLVLHDLLGLWEGRQPKFVKQYADLSSSVKDAVQKYCREVRAGVFPDKAHSYAIPQQGAEHEVEDREWKKKFKRALVRNILIGLYRLIRRLPPIVFHICAKIFFILGYGFMMRKRRLAMESLEVAFGNEKTAQERKTIARKYFDNFGHGMIELLYFLDRPQLIDAKVSIDGKEHLDKVLEAGNGAILVSAHFGNFILMYLKMIQAGYAVNVIMRRTRDPIFEKYISDFRNSHGLKTIYDLPSKKCILESLRALRNNEILFILLDQNYGRDGRVFVDFFGRKAATASGPVIFSQRTKAPILPIFIMRDQRSVQGNGHPVGNDYHKIVIEPPVLLDPMTEDTASIENNVSKLTEIIEKYIRHYPHEWGGWMHKRWKSRTIEEQMFLDRLKEKRAKASKA